MCQNAQKPTKKLSENEIDNVCEREEKRSLFSYVVCSGYDMRF